jgi:hypothetical protein
LADFADIIFFIMGILTKFSQKPIFPLYKYYFTKEKGINQLLSLFLRALCG